MKRYGWLFVLLLSLIIGCGGGTVGGPGGSPNSVTRERLQRTLGFSIISMLQGGFQSNGQAGAINGTTGSGTTGGTSSGTGGYGIPMIGAYLRNLGGGGNVPAFASKLRPRGDVGTTGSSTDGGGTGETTVGGSSGTTDGGETGTTDGGGPSFYYDEYLGLWTESDWQENSWTSLLYVDEGKTQPAGSFHSTYSDWDTYPVTGSSTYEITAGPFAGAHGQYETVFESELDGHMSYDNFWPGYGADEGASTWSENTWTWHSSQTLEDGSWSKSEGSYDASGIGRFVWQNSDGYKWSYTYNADGSGAGVIEGPDPGLPAHVSWTPEGHYRIEYADGTVEEFDMWGIMGGLGYGTSGGGGGGTVSTGSTGGGTIIVGTTGG
jgi:hypothetical protein